MVLLKTTVVVLLAVACVSAANSTFAKQSQDHAELNLPVEPIKPLSSGTNTTIAPSTTSTSLPPSTSTSTTTMQPPTTTTSSTTTPSNVTTHAPNVTTTTPVTTTTHSPNVTTTTPSPNVTTVVPPTPEPSPAPSPARSWDGPSFLGGMVLAFGIVAVGFVGYRFFYLGRGGAYHTL